VVDLSYFGFTDLSELDGMWTDASGSVALNLDGSADGIGDVIVFNGFAGESMFTDSNFDFG
jgi:hypothetical protein